MKANEYCENVRGAGPQRVLVRFAVTYPAAIPIRDTSGSDAGRHAAALMLNQPNQVVSALVVHTAAWLRRGKVFSPGALLRAGRSDGGPET